VEVDGDEEAYGRFTGPPSTLELERFFFLDDADKRLVAKRRGDHNRLGFAVQLGTVRFLGTFLADPTDVPTAVVDYVAEQVEASDGSCLKGYLRRRSTRFEHTAEIVAVYGYRDFAAAEVELVGWLDDRAWTTGEGPSALFDGAVWWLRERRVLLPGVSRLRRLVTRVRDAVTQRLWDVLAAMVTPAQARMLERLLEVPDGARVSELERLRRGPTVPSGKAMVAALERASPRRPDTDLRCFLSAPRLLELLRCCIPKRAVKSLVIVPHDPLEYSHSCLFFRGKVSVIDKLSFE